MSGSKWSVLVVGLAGLLVPAVGNVSAELADIDDTWFFEQPDTIDFLLDPPSLTASRGGPPVPRSARPTATSGDLTVVDFSVRHGSLETARYALIVGT